MISDFVPYAATGHPVGRTASFLLEGAGLAAVDGDARPDHPRGARRHHERDDVGDLVDGSEAPERELPLDEGGHPCRVVVLHIALVSSVCVIRVR